MSTLIDKLKAFGCTDDDLRKAVERFLNSEAFYERCLGKYLNDKSFAELGKCLESNVLVAREIFEPAHNLKGVTANMGITPILDEVNIIVEAVREDEDEVGKIDVEPEVLMEHYNKIMEYHAQLKDLVG